MGIMAKRALLGTETEVKRDHLGILRSLSAIAFPEFQRNGYSPLRSISQVSLGSSLLVTGANDM